MFGYLYLYFLHFIGSQYCREVLVIVADFTDGHVVFPAIAEKLKDIDIGILVNNVGLSYIHPEYFLEVTAQVLFGVNLFSCKWANTLCYTPTSK